MKKAVYLGVGGGIALVLAASILVGQQKMNRGQLAQGTVSIDSDDLGGVVTSAKGPEAGIWVIAETRDLPTKLIKIVVTDDQGRYVIPDLPKASYRVWTRGYGLVDSQAVQSAPGKILNLSAVVATNPRVAAEYYPANYWYSLLQIPVKAEFPGTGPESKGGNGISPAITSQGQWIRAMKTDGCEPCHALGDRATREIPKSLGTFASSVAAWDRRVQSGQDGGLMSGRLTTWGRERALKLFADWTDRIAAGEVPPAPPRPQGVERNIVISQWDWASPTEYFHDEIATDRRNPSINANGPVYGGHENSSDNLTFVDPVRHTAEDVKMPVRDPNVPFSTTRAALQPSPYWGEEVIWNSRSNAHSVTMDGKGRLWNTAVIRPPDNPAFCKRGSSHPSAKFPLERSDRQYTVYDPKSKQFTLIDTCFSTFHLNFAEDANDTLWTGVGEVVGWFNTKMFDETHDDEKSQGWTPLILDTNGNGRRDEYVEPDRPIDPTKDKRILASYYGVIPNPADGSIWGSVLGFPGSIVRLSPGSNPSDTALAEIYEVPWNNAKAPVQGFSPRGLDIDRNGVVWTVLASGHYAGFDRRKCKGPLNGPSATGQHCAEGWTLHPTPGPQFKGVTDSGSADSNYYNWVDQFGVLGLGRNTPIATGNGSEALLALRPDNGQWVVMRVPYPMGFFAKSMDARIDDPKSGWKGRGLWTTFATRTPWHLEGGKGTTSKAVKFQLRPDPLAK
jgi:hypothetical protein